MNTAKIIFVLLITWLLLQSQIFSSNRNDSTYLKKLYSKGEKAYLSKNYPKAKERLTKFISIPCPVNDTMRFSNPGYQYIMMKNKSCEYLKNVYFEEKDFRGALYYFKLTRGIYKLNIPRCGNNLYWEEPANALFESQCYEGLFEYDSALSVVALHVGWPFNQLNDRFIKLALKKVGSDSLKSEMTKSLNSITFIDNFFVINLLGHNINISFFGPIVEKRNYDISKFIVTGKDTEYVAIPPIVIPRTEEEIEEEKIRVKESFKQSDFYKLIMEN